jgi:hypothetical protein
VLSGESVTEAVVSLTAAAIEGVAVYVIESSYVFRDCLDERAALLRSISTHEE